MLVFFFAMASPAAIRETIPAQTRPLFPRCARPARSVKLHSSSTNSNAAPQVASSLRAGIIERIDFLGNRRIRSDTLKARIFTPRRRSLQ